MTKNTAISALYTDRRFNECIGKMNPVHLQNDLRQEVMMVLLEKPSDVIVAMAERDELLYYSMRVVCNLMKRERNGFIQKYRHVFEEVQDTAEDVCMDDITADVDLCPSVKCVLNGRVMKETREDAAIEKIAHVFSTLHWYDQQIFLDYVRTGSFSAIEKETRIPRQSTFKTVQKTIQKIKQHVQLD